MTLVRICQNVLNITGWDNFNTIAGNPDKTALQIMAIANQEVTNLSKRFDWRQLIRSETIATVADQDEYTVPANFDKLMQDSVYNVDEYYRLRSSMSEYQWNAWVHGLLGSLSHQRFRVVYSDSATAIKLSPVPSSVENLVYFYKINTPVKDESGELKAEFEVDSDVSLLPEDVVELGVLWRFKRAKGLDFSAELSEYNEASRTRFAQTKNEGDLPVPNSVLTPEVTDGYVPDSGFGA